MGVSCALSPKLREKVQRPSGAGDVAARAVGSVPPCEMSSRDHAAGKH